MTTQTSEFLTRLAARDAVLVTVQSHRGSVPREAGAWMAVFADDAIGSIGGGRLEWQAIAQARADLQASSGPMVRRYALGPSLGQCCGGEVQLRFERVNADGIAALQQRLQAGRDRWPAVALFGAGHVGRALVQVLGRLPLRVSWFDSRDPIFPARTPAQVLCEHSDPVQTAIAHLSSGTQVLIMTHSHAEDLELVAASLQRQRARYDLGLIGLIGSKTKWQTFRHRLAARGFSEPELAQVACPLGVPGVAGKEPEVIAVAVAAQVLQRASSLNPPAPPMP